MSAITTATGTSPPYTISRELLAEYRAVTPPQFQYLLGDLFETITRWENRAISATSVAKPDGHYTVTLKVAAKKVRAPGEQADRSQAGRQHGHRFERRKLIS